MINPERVGMNIVLNLDGNSQIDSQIEEVVNADISYGQYDQGYVVWSPQTESRYFVTCDGRVYPRGKDYLIGICKEFQDEYEEMVADAEIRWERHYYG